MEEKSTTRARRSTKSRVTYSPSRYDTPTTRQPRKSTSTVKKSSQAPTRFTLPAPFELSPPPTTVTMPSPPQEAAVIPPPKPAPFDFSNPTANELPGRRNKSKSVFEIAPFLYKKGTVRKSRKQSIKKVSVSENDNSGGTMTAENVMIEESAADSINNAGGETSDNDAISSFEPSTSSTQFFAFSSSKSPARRAKKPNPYALLPASYKDPKEVSASKSITFSSPIPIENTKSPSPISLPIESIKSSPSLPKESTPLPPTIDMPPPSQEAATFISPPKPAPFDFSNPTTNELPGRRNKSKSVFEIAPLLYKRDSVRKSRKQSIMKVSVSENDNSGGTMTAENVEGAAADSINNAGGETTDNNTVSKIAEATIKSNVSGVKKKRKKRPFRLTTKKRKHSRTSFAAEVYDEEIVKDRNEGEYDKADFDVDGSEDEAINECELENYGHHSAQFLSNLHPDFQASFKHYENDDGSYFTRFVLYGNTIKEDTEKPSEDMAVDSSEYPKYLNVFFNGATRIIDLCNDRLKETGAVDIFSIERINAKAALEILETKFNKENLCDTFIYGLSEIHIIILQSKTQNLPLPKMYIKCRDIATLIAHSFISNPTELLFIFHRFFLTHLDVDALIVYMVLCRFVNQVFKISNVLKEFTAPHLNEINTHFVETIKQNIVDPFREMVYKIEREFLTKDVVVVALVCNDVASDQYLSFQKLMLWFNAGFRKMGAIVESMTLSAYWNNPELVEISAYNAIAMVQSYLKFIVKSYPTSKIIVVNYGDPSMFFYHAIHFVERISGVINIAFPTYSYIDEVEHVRGGVEDTVLNMTYCPSLFVAGENSEISHYEQILKNYKSQHAGLIIVGDADDALTVSSKTLLHYGITPACVKRMLLEHFADFFEKCIVQPLPPKTYFPCANYTNDPDFELYNVVKEEVTAMHMKLFEQTKNYYDIRADLTRKLNKSKNNTKISPNVLSKEEIEGEIQSVKTEHTMEKFSKALVDLKFP
uniref:Uncharacterized protein n=1 Tax=Panagrolaimus sp. PS1159 TaxID=55785 RepID=A0AC35G342_9BILA